ncbi:hypothetical protein [Pararhizobium polonicum]|uniref:hypothetical protein n=1 Tax=Pararhizobium polonicum TaxID=1612624 RepID=UPI0011124777|nr:hypothetical protein [Pararhizobium polonicum]
MRQLQCILLQTTIASLRQMVSKAGGLMLHRYWFRFLPSEEASVLNLGCGVTAYSTSDAEQMIHALVFPLFGEREIEKIVEDIDVRSLEENHVRPNMGNPAARGVWFPLIQ